MSDNADNIDFLASPASAVTRSVGAKLRDVVSLKDFGAVGAVGADDTVALNKFLAAVGAGAKGIIPTGVYNFLAALDPVVGDNIEIEGAGDGTILQYVGASSTPGMLLTFGDGAERTGLRLTAFVLGSTTALTDGFGVWVRSYTYVEHDIVVNGPVSCKLHNGVWFDNCNYTNLHQSRFFCQAEGIRLSNCIEFHFQSAWIGGNEGAGVGVHAAGGNSAIYTEWVRQSFNDIGMLIDTSVVPLPNVQIFIGQGSTFDSNKTSAVTVNDTLGPGNMSKFIYADGWFATSGAGLIVINWTNGEIRSTTGVFKNNASGSGIYIADGTVGMTLGQGVSLDHNNVGVDASTPITIHSDAVPFSNAILGYSGNVTVKATRYGTQRLVQDPRKAWLIDATDNVVTVADGASVAIAQGSGKVIAANPNNGDVGEYNLGGASAAWVSSTLGTWQMPTKEPVRGHASITYDPITASYRLYNNTGGSRDFVVAPMMLLRTSN